MNAMDKKSSPWNLSWLTEPKLKTHRRVLDECVRARLVDVKNLKAEAYESEVEYGDTLAQEIMSYLKSKISTVIFRTSFLLCSRLFTMSRIVLKTNIGMVTKAGSSFYHMREYIWQETKFFIQVPEKRSPSKVLLIFQSAIIPCLVQISP